MILRTFAWPLIKAAGNDASQTVIKTVNKEGGQELKVTVKDAFQRYGKARTNGIVSGSKIGGTARFELLTLRLKALGEVAKQAGNNIKNKITGIFNKKTASEGATQNAPQTPEQGS